ncbi:MAG: PIN domain nuclease [Xanthomonadales bacterium]|jgi:predicted nucleic acid-binding protein|nr:PIN domain nuclease [Xanthomonadales bacterium]
MVLVDSSVWIDFFNGVQKPEVDRLDELLGEESILVGDLVLAEVLQGFDTDRGFRIARNLLLTLQQECMVSPDLALNSAQHYRTLRRGGITIRKTINCLIATWCIENRVPLLHSDKDFEPFEQHLGLVCL